LSSLSITPVGTITEEKVNFLHEFLLKELDWGGGPHLSHSGKQFVSAMDIGDKNDRVIKDWLLASPLGKFKYVVAIYKIAESRIYKAEEAFENVSVILKNPAGGFLFGVTKSKRGQFKVSNNWFAEVLGYSAIAVFKFREK
jgi:hypothetical protein